MHSKWTNTNIWGFYKQSNQCSFMPTKGLLWAPLEVEMMEIGPALLGEDAIRTLKLPTELPSLPKRSKELRRPGKLHQSMGVCFRSKFFVPHNSMDHKRLRADLRRLDSASALLNGFFCFLKPIWSNACDIFKLSHAGPAMMLSTCDRIMILAWGEGAGGFTHSTRVDAPWIQSSKVLLTTWYSITAGLDSSCSYCICKKTSRVWLSHRTPQTSVWGLGSQIERRSISVHA